MFLVDEAQSTVTGTFKCFTNFSHNTGVWGQAAINVPYTILWHWSQAKMDLQLFPWPGILTALVHPSN